MYGRPVTASPVTASPVTASISLLRSRGHALIPEWMPHRAVWCAWPHDAAEWGPAFEPARDAFGALVAALAAGGEAVEVLVRDPAEEASALTAFARHGARAAAVRTHVAPYGDVWTRDTGPLFMVAPDGARVALCCEWNGWGGKYLMDGDDGVAHLIAASAALPTFDADFVLEGGAIEIDGTGTLLTTRSCLLHPNRHPGAVPTEAALEARLRAWLGVERIVWIDDGLHFDHTDGHVDNIARFVAPGVVAIGAPDGAGDPHRDRLVAIREQVTRHGLEVVPLPSPGRVENPHTGELLPASHLNFFIAQHAIVVPVYGRPSDDAACRQLEALFPGRRSLPVFATHLLTGGGSVHCMTKEEPACPVAS